LVVVQAVTIGRWVGQAAELRGRLIRLANQAKMTPPSILTHHHDQNLHFDIVSQPLAEPVNTDRWLPDAVIPFFRW